MSATDSFITLKSKCGILPADLNVILLKQDLSDVQFVVTDEDGGTKSFDAHKLVLAVASDVLRTMFYGSVPQTSPVQIPDSSPAAFEAFLRFIYTGAAVITEAEVFRMLYLAKKYLVSTLKEAVMSYLESRIKPDNVGQIILHGQDYLEDAPDRFWEGVERNAESLLQSSEFTLLRQDTLAVLLRRSLEADELLIYDKVVAWSEAECVRKLLPCTVANMRDALGDVIRLVRFPVMSIDEFTHGPGTADILTPEEKVDVFKWLNGAIAQSTFPDAQRFTRPEYACERFTGSKCTGWSTSGSMEAIDFKLDTDIFIIGFGVYGPYSSGTQNCTVSATLYRGEEPLAFSEVTNRTAEMRKDVIAIKFKTPIKSPAEEEC